MAKVLGQIAERLKTDLGELARATVDPDFSRRRDLSNFENDKHERNRQEALADQARLREEKIADRNRAEKIQTQRYAVVKLFDNAMTDSSGKGWERYMGLGASGSLMPEMQEAWALLAEGAGGVSLEARKFDYQRKQDFKKMSREERELTAKLSKWKTDSEIAFGKFIIDENKEDRVALENFRKESQEDQSVFNIHTFFNDLPDNEGQKYLNMMAQGENSYTHAAKVLDIYTKDFNNEKDREAAEIRAGIIAARQGADPLPATANKNVIDLASVFTARAIEKLPDNQKSIAEDHLGDFNRLVAQIALDSARKKNARTVTVDNLEAAFNAVTSALQNNPEPPEVSLNPGTWLAWAQNLVGGAGEFDPKAAIDTARDQGLIGSNQPQSAGSGGIDAVTAAEIQGIIDDQNLVPGEIFLHTFPDGSEKQIRVK